MRFFHKQTVASIQDTTNTSMNNLLKSYVKILLVTLLVCAITNTWAQNKCGFSLDTTAKSEHLNTFLHKLDTIKFENYLEKKYIPETVFNYLSCEIEEKFTIADSSEEWRCCCTSPRDLPATRLVFISISRDLVLLEYLTGGIGVFTHLIAFILKDNYIVEIWKGYGDNSLRSGKDVAAYSTINHDENVGPEWERWIPAGR